MVFGTGNINSKIMIIGEGPGAQEDVEGIPFVGRAGKLLDKMLGSIQLDRTKVYISNVVNYRPPANRKPTESEIAKYLPYLKSHIQIINPRIIMLLGSTALNALIGNEVVISKARGRWIQKEIGKIGYKFQFITLAGFHAQNYAVFDLARKYKNNGMTAYSALQQQEFASESDGYTATKHQKEVGTSYFDAVSNTISSGKSSTNAMKDSTETEQF